MPENPRQADAAIDALFAGLGSGGGAAARQQEPNVFLGRTRNITSPNAGEHGLRAGWSNYDKTAPVTEVVNQWYDWNDKQRQAWGTKLFNAGVIRTPNDYNGMFQAWNDAVNEAGRYYTLGKKRVTPWQVVDLFATGKTGPTHGPRTTTSTAVQLPSKSEAAAGIRKIWQDQLGRDPTSAELKKYTGLLTSTARANPQSTTTTHVYDKTTGAEVSQSSVSSGGFDAGELLSNQAEDDPEYGAYQAATTLYGWLNKAIGAPG